MRPSGRRDHFPLSALARDTAGALDKSRCGADDVTKGIGRGERDMGNIGTERREVEFEPLPENPVTEPARESEPAPQAPAPAQT